MEMACISKELYRNLQNLEKCVNYVKLIKIINDFLVYMKITVNSYPPNLNYIKFVYHKFHYKKGRRRKLSYKSE